MKKWSCVFNNRLLQIFIHIYFVTIKNNQVSLVSRLEIQQTLSFISYLHRMFLDRTKELKTDTFVWLIPVSHTQAHMRRHSGCQLHFQCNSIDHGLEVAKFCTVKLFCQTIDNKMLKNDENILSISSNTERREMKRREEKRTEERR